MTQEKKSGKGTIQIRKTPLVNKKTVDPIPNQAAIFSSKKFDMKVDNEQENERMADRIQDSSNIFQPANQVKAEFLSRVYGKPMIPQNMATEKIAAL